jgi:UDP-N-acetylglucosamine 3-dehydrogenase
MVINMKRIGIGIIGCGSIAQKVHVPSFLGTPETKLVALADSNFKLAKEVAVKNNIDNVFDDYRELLECDKVDAVSVCTPPKTHCQIVVDACLANKHVLCEKPIALSLKEADKMISEAKKANVTLAIGHQYRFMRNIEKAKEFINRKYIGKILTCYGELVGGGPFFEWKTSSDYHLQADSGIDVLFNYGTHIVDIFNFFFGKALKVSSQEKTNSRSGSCRQINYFN